MPSIKPNRPAKGVAEPSYAVHRPSEQQPSSSTPAAQRPAQENGHAEEDHRASTPPPYSGPTSSSMSVPRAGTQPQRQVVYPGLPRLEYALYAPQNFTLSSDKTTVTTYEPQLSAHAATLLTLIQKLATIPPKPHVRILGRRDSDVDFDIKINMMHLIVPEPGKVGMNYVKVIANGEAGFRGSTKETIAPARKGGLEEWVTIYCEDQNAIKQFTLERTVLNWDTSYIQGRLLSLLSSTSYTGQVTVSFPLTHTRVVVRPPDKFNRFFSNVTKAFTGMRTYEVVKSVWPYADVARGEPGRTCLVQEEEEWFRHWSDIIRHAVVLKRKGWVTAEDRLEFLMEPSVAAQQQPSRS